MDEAQCAAVTLLDGRSREHETCRHNAYWMTCEELDELLDRAGGRCEICGVLGYLTPHGRLHIDHDALLGEWAVRGLLCSRCNTMLGRGAGLAGPAIDAYLAQPWRVVPPTSFLTGRRQPPSPSWSSSIDAVVAAFGQIAAAEQSYRSTLRSAVASGASQAEISRRLDRTREMLRRDAMTEAQREALRLTEAERKRQAKGGRKGRRS